MLFWEQGTHSKFVRNIEGLVGKQLVELITGLDAVALVVILGSEDLGDVRKVPGLNVIVSCIPTVDVSLDGVTLVANHKPGVCERMN